MDAYFHEDEWFCPRCANQRTEALRKSGVTRGLPDGPFAKGGGRADTPQHCAACSVFLRNPLTAFGLEFVFSASLEARCKGAWEEKALFQWAPFYRVVLRELERDKVRKLLVQADAFTTAYVEALLASDLGDDDRPLDACYSAFDLDYPAVQSILKDCKEFQEKNGSLLGENDAEQAGYDFLHTRNGSGVGFWDGDWPINGDALTEACKGCGAVNAYEVDGGSLSITPLSWQP